MKAKVQISYENVKLVSLCKKGDISAFETLVDKHQKQMFNIAYRMTEIMKMDENCAGCLYLCIQE